LAKLLITTNPLLAFACRLIEQRLLQRDLRFAGHKQNSKMAIGKTARRRLRR